MSLPGTYAFFDLDGTLISEASMITFLRHYLHAIHAPHGERHWRAFESVLAEKRGQTPREALNAWYYAQYLQGARVATLRDIAQAWLDERRDRAGFFKTAPVERLQMHRSNGTPVVLLTGSFREIVQPLAELLGAEHIICAPLEEVDGSYTGRLMAAPTIGAGKLQAIRAFLSARGADPLDCYGYGDDDSDLPFLQYIGRPHAVADGTPSLLAYARKRGWPMIGASQPLVDAAAV
ncbi:MAG: HAD-IB family hydrolase [Burkholderiales bacterium]|nr:HAD-IB family hydrolase [Burkholderiales bacterium]